MKHFKYFPQIEYSNNIATNILVRAKIRDLVLENTTSFYSYYVKDVDRPDTLSHIIYGSGIYTWLIFYANNIFDPLYDWPLNEKEFEKYIIQKYGSVGNARSRANEAMVLTLSEENSLGTFVLNQQVFQGVSFNNFISRGIVTEWNPNTLSLRLKNVEGDFHPASGNLQVTGGGVNFAIRLRRNLIHHYEIINGRDKDLIIDQKTFLDPFQFVDQEKKAITFYEHELRLNEQKKNIKLIKRSEIDKIINELRNIFN